MNGSENFTFFLVLAPQNLVDSLGMPAINISQSHGQMFEIDVTEGVDGHFCFSANLGISAVNLTVAEVLGILKVNSPQAQSVPNILGVCPKTQNLCLWNSASMDNMQLSECVDMLNRLIYQAELLRKSLDVRSIHVSAR
jgi:hypothetical protein